MVIRKVQGRRRWAAAAVELGLVMIPLTMFLFGIFEYGRLLLDWNLLNNATREGCRYALANNTSSTLNTTVQNTVTSYMGGRSGDFTSFTVTITGTHQGTSTTVANLVAGDMITVTVSGTYKFLPVVTLIKVPSSIPISSSVTMLCEGGT
jgi:Flp pilus assembly protein TadG